MGRPLRTTDLPDELAVSVVTVGELRAGVLAATHTTTRVTRLDTFTLALSFEPLPIDQSAAESRAHCGSSYAKQACGCRSTTPGSPPRPRLMGFLS
jgi:predicted nucleic acid-binding protein